eukprot:Pompholyxophrys_punicea_v1_NODE_179_length_2990_cov_78.650085.p1 type:complete len:456 gc:universal NODE_179_length_2990_cov_78.650085:2815-1448(-)
MIYHQIKQQLLCISQSDARGFRWDEAVIHWAMTVQFYGGKLVIDTIRGKSTEGQGSHGHLPLNISDWNIFIPADSTLRSYLPYVNPYAGITDERVTCGFACDEIEIRKGLVYRNGGLIGLADFVPEKDVQDLRGKPISSIRAKLSSHVVQIFLTSTDGVTCLPLGFLPSCGMDGTRMTKLVKHWSKILRQNINAPVELLWGSTDGFKTNHDFVEKMKKESHTYLHFFDYIHILKNIRNTICNHYVKTPDCPDGFHMTDLVTLREIRNDIQKLLPKEPNPKDKMEMKNIEQLLKEDFLTVLGRETSPALKGLHKYFSHMSLFFKIFDDNDLKVELKKIYIAQVKLYFNNLQEYTNQYRLGNNLYFQIVTTLDYLLHLWTIVSPENVLTSCLGTNVCENFFSLVRRKVRYPSLWDYACYYARAKMEHIKLNADDNLNRIAKDILAKNTITNKICIIQ